MTVHHSATRKEGNYIFPLYLNGEIEGLLHSERRANLNPAFVAALTKRIGTTPMPEDVLYYTYAVFRAPTYRTRYASFLKIDFLRLPLPPDGETFHALAELDTILTALHLLESPLLTPPRIAYSVSGDHVVEKRNVAKRYVPPTSPRPSPQGEGRGEVGGQTGRVWLNSVEYFDNVPPEAWEFRVGGYQPAFKWLDDRAGRTLTEADLTHYRKMLAALRETAALLPTVDAAFAWILSA